MPYSLCGPIHRQNRIIAEDRGYDRMADGSVRAATIRFASMPEMMRRGAALKKMYPSYHYNELEHGYLLQYDEFLSSAGS